MIHHQIEPHTFFTENHSRGKPFRFISKTTVEESKKKFKSSEKIALD